MNPRSKLVLCLFSAVTLGAGLVVACNDASSASAVNVSLREFSVTADQQTVPKGTVTFHVTNTGTVPHEFLVIKTNLAPQSLPTESNGSYAENGPGTTLLDEIDEVDPGQSKDLSIALDSASYVLICNMVHQNPDGSVIAHYAQGMRTAFRVD